MDKFLGFRGRIGRGRWWLGVFTLFILSLALYFALAFAFGISVYALIGLGTFDAAAFAEMQRTGAIIALIITIALIYPSLSLSAQRINDRDRPTGLVWLTLVPSILTGIAGYLGLSMTWTEVNGVAMPQPTPIGWAVNAIAALIGLWILIDLGILRGTKGPNRHGPDPLER